MAKKIVYNPTDPAIQYTEDEIKDLESKINAVYSEAESDVQRKMDEFNAKHQKKDAKYQKMLKDGEISEEQYASWKKGQVFTGKQWAAKKNEISAILHNSNVVATSMVNNSALNVFGENSNYMAYSMEHQAGVNFGFQVYNKEAVTRLIKDDPQLLPKWKVDQKKDYVWNQKNINNALTQGIIQGESLNKISKRVSTGLAGKNENLMKTFAKTGMTQAQNSGRLERMYKLKARGVDIEKKWVATLDKRTRYSHRELDGQTVDLDDKFETEGYSIAYPGDPEAHPSLVYNCRCAIVSHFNKYPSKYDRYDNINGVPIEGMSYNEWKQAKELGKDIVKKAVEKKVVEKTVVNGKDISYTWERRPDEFNFEIEDVINAQGFDGLPRVVDPEEFEKCVREANDGNGFIAQRTYAAPNQETLDTYRDQLYNGKWYVDCSTGGAQYGQGMYCAADYTGTLTDGVKAEMSDYIRLGESRINAQIEELKTESSKFFSSLSRQERDDLALARYGIQSPNANKERGERLLARLTEIQKREEELTKNITPLSYIETLTLDKSAKIISYDDIYRMQINESSGSRLISQFIKDSNLTLDEKALIFEDYRREMLGHSDIFTYEDIKVISDRAKELNKSLSFDEWYEERDKAVEKLNMPKMSDLRIKGEKLRKMDIGSYAVLKGYDAINAEGHGKSGSYTVVLNRTKLIIKGE